MAKDDKTNLGSGRAKRASDKALFVELDTGDSVWIPKSQIHDDSEVYEEGHEGEVVVNTWWAEKNDLA